MKATYRAKFNALCAMNDGYSFITIKRNNDTYIVDLDDILNTPNREKVPESIERYKYEINFIEMMSGSKHITYREMMKFSK